LYPASRIPHPRSPIPQRIPPGIDDVSFYIHPESDKKVNDQGRAHGEERNIDKVFADRARSNANFFSNGRTNAEYMPFHKVLESIHDVKI
jgi:hypothetical protein